MNPVFRLTNRARGWRGARKDERMNALLLEYLPILIFIGIGGRHRRGAARGAVPDRAVQARPRKALRL